LSPATPVQHPHGAHLIGQRFQLAQVVEIQGVGAANRQRNAVHHDRISLGQLVQNVPGSSAGIHEVLKDDLKPIDGRSLLQ
jgi:hypothetical protein